MSGIAGAGGQLSRARPTLLTSDRFASLARAAGMRRPAVGPAWRHDTRRPGQTIKSSYRHGLRSESMSVPIKRQGLIVTMINELPRATETHLHKCLYFAEAMLGI